MSLGSFCRSESMNTMISPEENSIPADMAAVWPKLRRNIMTLMLRSFFAMSLSIFGDASMLPSSMKMIS